MKIKLVAPKIIFIAVFFICIIGTSYIHSSPSIVNNNRLDKESERYLLYLHGQIIENEGVRPTSKEYGIYEYQQILDTFTDKGFTVLSEARPKNTERLDYAKFIKGQIDSMLSEGVSPSNITVVGASKGGVIAMYVSAIVQNVDINYVILASFNDYCLKIFKEGNYKLSGNVLSIYDSIDKFGGTYEKFIDYSKSKKLRSHKEIQLEMDLGHALLYRPYKEWIEPTIEWASGK